MRGRRLWVARPTPKQRAAHDSDIGDAARALVALRMTIDDELISTGVRGTVETSDGLTLNTAADLLRYLRAVHR
jgi:hypothetical protein